MNETFSAMQSRIEDLCVQIERSARNLPPSGDPRRIEALRKILDRMISEFGVYDYAFSYAAQQYASTYVGSCVPELTEIYHEGCDAPFYDNTSETPGSARLRGFVAFFLIVTYYVHFKLNDEAAALLADERYSFSEAFRDMPLLYDLLSRCEKRDERCANSSRALRKALLQERKAIDMLERLHCQNVAVSCSFASTVSIMLQRKLRVDASDAEKAVSLIGAAIDYNPDYAKYFYIRGKLRFYMNSEKDPAERQLKTLYAARDDCELAIIRENNLRKDFQLRVADYTQLLDLIEERIEQLEAAVETDGAAAPCLCPEELEALRREILESPNEEALHHFPPANDRGGKYVFICYNRADYKLVYSDLLEMTARGIPFLYDHGTVLPGYNWDTAVAARIRDPNCVGIIFYLGPTAVFSKPLDKEIQVVRQKAESLCVTADDLLFCVNLTKENDTPSKMLIRAIRGWRKASATADLNSLTSERIVRFLSTFTDEGDFIRRGEDPGDLNHMDQIAATIREKFHIQPWGNQL